VAFFLVPDGRRELRERVSPVDDRRDRAVLDEPGQRQQVLLLRAPDSVRESMAALFPHLAAMMADIVHDDPDSTLGWCDDQFEFEFGLDLILDGLDRLRSANGRDRA